MNNYTPYRLGESRIPYILSLAYQDKIQNCCNKPVNFNLNNFVVYIVFNNNSKFVLSNIFKLLVPYYTENLYKEDYSFSDEIINNKSYYLCDKTPSVSSALKKELEDRFSVHRAYYIIRKTPEMTFVFGAIKNTPIENNEIFYKNSIREFEDFCVEFLDEFVDLIADCNPQYKNSFAFTNSRYRKAVIKAEYYGKNLTTREVDCLNLAARGNSSKEIAKLLKISNHTADTHIKNLKVKLNCKTIQESILEGILQGHIGNIFVKQKNIFIPTNSFDNLKLINTTEN